MVTFPLIQKTIYREIFVIIVKGIQIGAVAAHEREYDDHATQNADQDAF